MGLSESTYTFITKVKELNKVLIAQIPQKYFPPLTLTEESEWMQYFNEQKQKANELQSQITQIAREKDRMALSSNHIQLKGESMRKNKLKDKNELK